VSAAIATIDEAAWVDIPYLTSDAAEAGKTALVNVYV